MRACIRDPRAAGSVTQAHEERDPASLGILEHLIPDDDFTYKLTHSRDFAGMHCNIAGRVAHTRCSPRYVRLHKGELICQLHDLQGVTRPPAGPGEPGASGRPIPRAFFLSFRLCGKRNAGAGGICFPVQLVFCSEQDNRVGTLKPSNAAGVRYPSELIL
jgi:hypothetical protein